MSENIERDARLGVSPRVIHETIEAETIAINLTTGTYYSLKDTAAEAWALVDQSGGLTVDDLLDVLVSRFDASREEVDAGLTPFLAELLREDLVAYTTEPSDVGSLATSAGEGAARQAFTPPALEKFTDMQDLVLLDPVHEVDAVGWPHPSPTPEAAPDALAS